MDYTETDRIMFFNSHPGIYPLFEEFYSKVMTQFPESKIKVQKTQISFYNKHLYACISFLKVKRSTELPDDYFVLTLGLPFPLDSDRVAAKTEPYPGRWTIHFIISDPTDLDQQMYGWISQAYCFAENK